MLCRRFLRKQRTLRFKTKGQEIIILELADIFNLQTFLNILKQLHEERKLPRLEL
jgi:hypothetical protein